MNMPTKTTIRMKRSRFLMGQAALLVMAMPQMGSAFSLRTPSRTAGTPLAAGFSPDMRASKARSRSNENDWFHNFAAPVVSSSLLITGNTVGAGCLVLPELAAGPGLSSTIGVFVLSWIVNILSAFVLSEVAITQKENSQNEVPSSFQEFAATNLGASAGTMVSAISLFVNACVLSFDLSRAGLVGGRLTGLPAESLSIGVAMALVAAMSTFSTQQLSSFSTLCVGALFLSFGGLLVPGLLGVSDVAGTFLQPGIAPDMWESLGHCAPIILMSMIFQNIVPTVVKLQNYDRTKTAASIVLGSAIPLIMYISWCFACLGGGIDTESLGVSGLFMTIFSVSTLGGSSLCSSMSLAEEIETKTTPTEAPAFGLTSALAAVSIPLAAAVFVSNDGAGLTGALSLAGSFGSPLLYGAIPAAMAWRQQQEKKPSSDLDLAPAAALPILASLSMGFVGQELVSRTQEALPFMS